MVDIEYISETNMDGDIIIVLGVVDFVFQLKLENAFNNVVIFRHYCDFKKLTILEMQSFEKKNLTLTKTYIKI